MAAHRQSIQEEIESRNRNSNMTGPRVTPAMIEAEIADEDYSNHFGTLTICILRLRNGFLVTGESACVAPENFDIDIGQKIARRNAVDKIWGLLGFRLRDQLYLG